MTALDGALRFDRLDTRNAENLASARLVLHWAAQLPAAAGASLAPAVDDFSHTSLTWLDDVALLASVALTDGRRVALSLADLRLAILAPDGTVATDTALEGLTLDEALAFLGRELGATLARPAHDLPDHPLAHGARFAAPAPEERAALAELSRWFGNAARLLDAIATDHPNATLVRCWPHHFDIATLIRLDTSTDETARSIGVGLSPGDGSYSVPYLYVTPWPYPKTDATDALPPLAGGGRWHREGWTGAVLAADAITARDPDAQRAVLVAFLRSAVAASLTLL